jgi:Activator of Hsp90 ATPase homolog 1-like protein
VLEVLAPERIAFTYGYENGKPSPPGSSRVTIRLDAHPHGTLLPLTHEFADSESRDEHVQGWRFQLSLFANLIAAAVNEGATSLVDRWFATWSESDAGTRDRSLAALEPISHPRSGESWNRSKPNVGVGTLGVGS